MTNYDVVKKLIGNVTPIGDANIDNERFENLKSMCELIERLRDEIKATAYGCKDSREFSVKRAGEYADTFINDLCVD